MSDLYAIRHGQAGFLTDNYDQLSELGRKQSVLLGEWLVRYDIRFDAVYTGPRERQKDTEKAVRQVYGAAGIDLPEVVMLPELDEVSVHLLFEDPLPDIVEDNPELGGLIEAFEQSASFDDRRRTFNKLFAEVTQRWVRGEVQAEGVESWKDFAARVGRALDTIRADDRRGLTVAAFTSGGVIAALLQRSFACPDDRALEFMWHCRNSAWAQFRYTAEKLSMTGFNGTPHLDDPALWTYR